MKKLLTLALALCLCLSSAALAETAAPTTPPNAAGRPYLLDDWEDAPVTLSEWKGKVTFLNFFTTWCTYCQREMPDLKALQEKYGDALRVVLVHIPSGENEETARAFLKENDLEDLTFVEDNGFFAYMYDIEGYPLSVVMDAEGYLSDYFPRAIEAATMEEAVIAAGVVLPEASQTGGDKAHAE